MKDKSFNLGKIGKQMPYRTPEGFFGELEGKYGKGRRMKASFIQHQTPVSPLRPGQYSPQVHLPGNGSTEEPAAITPSQDPPS